MKRPAMHDADALGTVLGLAEGLSWAHGRKLDSREREAIDRVKELYLIELEDKRSNHGGE